MKIGFVQWISETKISLKEVSKVSSKLSELAKDVLKGEEFAKIMVYSRTKIEGTDDYRYFKLDMMKDYIVCRDEKSKATRIKSVLYRVCEEKFRKEKQQPSFLVKILFPCLVGLDASIPVKLSDDCRIATFDMSEELKVNNKKNRELELDKFRLIHELLDKLSFDQVLYGKVFIVMKGLIQQGFGGKTLKWLVENPDGLVDIWERGQNETTTDGKGVRVKVYCSDGKNTVVEHDRFPICKASQRQGKANSRKRDKDGKCKQAFDLIYCNVSELLQEIKKQGSSDDRSRADLTIRQVKQLCSKGYEGEKLELPQIMKGKEAEKNMHCSIYAVDMKLVDHVILFNDFANCPMSCLLPRKKQCATRYVSNHKSKT
jgi:hypothetical protein